MCWLPLDQLNTFLSFVQNFHRAFDFSCTISNSSVTFFDILVYAHHPALNTSIHYMHSDTHSYLFYYKSHAKLSIPSSQFLCLHRLSRDDHGLIAHSKTMDCHLLVRVYPFAVIQSFLKQARFVNRSTAYSLRPSTTINRLPFHLT